MSKESKSFEATVDSLEPIRDFISEKAEAAGAGKKKIYALCLAIDEIATNIARYGYPKVDITDGEIVVLIETVADSLEVILEDNGFAFDPLKHMVPTEEDISKPLEDRPIGGLGIMMAKQSVDKFDYEYVDGKNRNIFIIKIA